MPTLGTIKLKDITAARLDMLYKDMREHGAVSETVTLKEGSALPEWVKKKSTIVRKSMGVSDASLRHIVRGEPVKRAIAERVAAYYEKPLIELFEVRKDKKPLSARTVRSIVIALASIFFERGESGHHLRVTRQQVNAAQSGHEAGGRCGFP
jgi:hypothetical protein